ncbi:MAG: peptide-methionine (S)-S-oxide reductase MsrA [Bowdeniella nasicola]|nr:peptide-methionine (S)-S-oxide reductase MsrA [Bowdeniella nasicola]
MLGNNSTAGHSDAPAEIGFAMGCFWGVQRLFDSLEQVVLTTVGYMGGTLPSPTYEQVCRGQSGHAETIWVTYRGDVAELITVFFENHDPTQGDRQGNDIGSQYRSMIFPTTQAQATCAAKLAERYATALSARGFGPITTEIATVGAHRFWPAEQWHQKYLEKNPGGYCPVHATGVCLA